MEDINAFDLLRYDIDRHMDDCDEDYSDIIHTLYRTIDNIMDICRNTLSIYGKTFKDFKYAVKKIDKYNNLSARHMHNSKKMYYTIVRIEKITRYMKSNVHGWVMLKRKHNLNNDLVDDHDVFRNEMDSYFSSVVSYISDILNNFVNNKNTPVCSKFEDEEISAKCMPNSLNNCIKHYNKNRTTIKKITNSVPFKLAIAGIASYVMFKSLNRTNI